MGSLYEYNLIQQILLFEMLFFPRAFVFLPQNVRSEKQ